MGWEPASWLAFARTFQVLTCFGAIGLHGFLTIRIYTSEIMVALTLLTCAVLGYTILALFLQTGERLKRGSWLAAFLLGDSLMCAVLIAILTILAYNGLPMHCGGLNEDGWPKDPRPNDGALGEHCSLERGNYIITAALVFTYIFTIVLGLLRFLEHHYTKNTKVSELLDSLDRAEDIQLKLVDTPTPRPESPRPVTPPAQPPSEGVITRSTSLRSTVTTATTSTTSQTHSTNPYRTNLIPRRPIGQPPPPMPPRPFQQQPRSPMYPGPGFVAVPLEDEDKALVADGMQHPGRPSRDQQQHLPMLSEEAQAADAALFVADGMQHQRRASSRDQYHHPAPNHYHHHHRRSQHSFSRPMPMLSEEGSGSGQQSAADDALVSDGMRPEEPALPAYHPGNNRMVGHAGESNEMRLSEYVKGETRAQGMKDSGNY